VTADQDLVHGKWYQLTTRGKYDVNEAGFINATGARVAYVSSVRDDTVTAEPIPDPLPTASESVVVTGPYAWVRGVDGRWRKSGQPDRRLLRHPHLRRRHRHHHDPPGELTMPSTDLRSRATTGTAVAQNDGPPSIGQLIERLRPEMQRALPKHMDADRMARLALTVLRKTPALANCTPESFMGALMTAAQLGLELGASNEAYLTPYKREAQLIVGYQGYAKLFYQHPLAKHLDAQVVYENDDFDYEYGLTQFLRHKPARGDRGKIIYYYAVASLSTGAAAFTVLTPDEVKALRGGKQGTSGGIADPQHWMEKKTCVRQVLKMLPKSTDMMRALAADETIRVDVREDAIDTAGVRPVQVDEGLVEVEGPPAGVDAATGEVGPEGGFWGPPPADA
jgi:recombination protein RecT